MKDIPIYGITEFTEADLSKVLYVNNLKKHLATHQFVNHPHKHSTYITVFFTSGQGTHEIDFQTYPVQPGSLFLLTPGQVHCWNLSDDADGFVVFHTEGFYNNAFLTRRISDFPFFYLQTNYPVIYLTSVEQSTLSPIFQWIYEESRYELPFKSPKLISLIDVLYIELARVYSDNRKNGEEYSHYCIQIKKLEKLIEENFRTLKLPKEYADLMNMTTRHLNRICQQSLNQSTGKLILTRTIIEAKRMLVHSDTSVNAVADYLGYDDYSYFVRLFKKEVGETPKQFQLRLASERASERVSLF